jgi:hypothetical protein
MPAGDGGRSIQPRSPLSLRGERDTDAPSGGVPARAQYQALPEPPGVPAARGPRHRTHVDKSKVTQVPTIGAARSGRPEWVPPEKGTSVGLQDGVRFGPVSS